MKKEYESPAVEIINLEFTEDLAIDGDIGNFSSVTEGDEIIGG